MKDAAFCSEVLNRSPHPSHPLAVYVLEGEQRGWVVMRYPDAGCFLTYQPSEAGRGLMQLAFSQFSRGVVGCIGKSLDQFRHCTIDANTQDDRIRRLLCDRFGFVVTQANDQNIKMTRAAHVL
ncbi:MAG: hypothetical protein WCZ98_01420 [Sideroxydans sp.]